MRGLDCPRPVRNVSGKNALRADRLLCCCRLPANCSTEDLSDMLSSALEDACGGDDQLYERSGPMSASHSS